MSLNISCPSVVNISESFTCYFSMTQTNYGAYYVKYEIDFSDNSPNQTLTLYSYGIINTFFLIILILN